MAKSISAGLTTHIQSAAMTLAVCCKLTRKDLTVLGFTNHDKNIVYDGVTYKAATAINQSNIQQSSDLGVNNLNLQGLIDSSDITEADIRANKYENAQIHLFLINWADTSQGILKSFRGWIGDISLKQGLYVADVRGLSQALQDNLLFIVQPSCQADFGDANCGKDLTALTQTGTVDVVTSNRAFTTTGLTIAAADEFNGGVLTWTAGNNNGIKCEVKDSTLAGGITLYLKTAGDIANGDTFSIYPGCDKSLSTCKDTYDNILNFYMGFPHAPDRNQITELPDANE